ncbi:hypothetical protein B0H13DRAFT_1909918 [Mycena leptocephala]|nr:hypothetical protein B0H13DRAFT_1909918 [Mycena leptocephala]
MYDSSGRQGLRSPRRSPVLLLPHSRIKFLRIVRKLVDRALDRRVPSEGCEEIGMRIKISFETLQVVRGGVKIIILAGGLKRDTGIDARQVREWADGAGYLRNSLDEEFHRGEVVPHRMDVKKDLMLPFLLVARKGVEVEFGWTDVLVVDRERVILRQKSNVSTGTVGEGLSTTENGESARFEDGMGYGAELAQRVGGSAG